MSVSVKLNEHRLNIPKPLHTCFSYLLENGDIEGIFRLNGSVKRVNHFTKEFLENPDLDLNKLKAGSDELVFTVHDIATVFKRLLSHYLKRSNSVIVDNSDQLSEIQLVCQKFTGSPVTLVRKTCSILNISNNNTNILLYLTFNLNKMSKLEKTTHMNISNLAIIFQPHFFNSELISDIEDLKKFRNAIEAYIEYCDILIEELGRPFPQPTVKVKIVSVIKSSPGVEIVTIATEKKPALLKRAFSMSVKRLKL